MPVPTLPHLVLLFFLGGVFLHFTLAGARTFYSRKMEDEPGGCIGQITFVFGGTVPVWFLGLYQPIRLSNGIVAAAVLLGSVALYEWARHTIWGRRFGLGWGEHVPEELCVRGPYRFVRHPIYLSYLLAFLAALIALPHWITLGLFVANVVLFAHAAVTDERVIATSSLASDYAAYRRKTGMLWPRFSRATPGRSTP